MFSIYIFGFVVLGAIEYFGSLLKKQIQQDVNDMNSNLIIEDKNDNIIENKNQNQIINHGQNNSSIDKNLQPTDKEVERLWLEEFESEPSQNVNTQKVFKNGDSSGEQYFSEFGSSQQLKNRNWNLTQFQYENPHLVNVSDKIPQIISVPSKIRASLDKLNLSKLRIPSFADKVIYKNKSQGLQDSRKQSKLDIESQDNSQSFKRLNNIIQRTIFNEEIHEKEKKFGNSFEQTYRQSYKRKEDLNYSSILSTRNLNYKQLKIQKLNEIFEETQSLESPTKLESPYIKNNQDSQQQILQHNQDNQYNHYHNNKNNNYQIQQQLKKIESINNSDMMDDYQIKNEEEYQQE